MTITKCDLCKKEIKKSSDEVRAGIGWGIGSATLCTKCGKPIIDFLKKN